MEQDKIQVRSKWSSRIWGVLLLTIAVFVGGYVVGNFYPTSQITRLGKGIVFEIEQKDQPSSQAVTLDMTNFWRVLELVSENYLDADNIDPVKLVDGATAGIVSALGDPYTSYYTQDANTGFKDTLEGVYEGIGVQLGFKENNIAVIAPLTDSPAALAGLRAGDYIVAVDGKETIGWSIPQAVDAIRGEADTVVNLTINRQTDANSFEIAVTRAQIKIPAVKVSLLADGIAHVSILRFGSDTNSEWDKVVARLKEENVRGIVLDVRNNPGGLLDSAVYIASDFIEEGTVLKRQTNTETTEMKVSHACRLCNFPVVVLINEGSASASEILAGALKVRNNTKLIGEKSFGKGTVQEAIDLTAGAAVHITTARWLLPDGQSIHTTGITPDEVVEIMEAETSSLFQDGATDPQINAGIEALN